MDVVFSNKYFMKLCNYNLICAKFKIWKDVKSVHDFCEYTCTWYNFTWAYSTDLQTRRAMSKGSPVPWTLWALKKEWCSSFLLFYCLPMTAGECTQCLKDRPSELHKSSTISFLLKILTTQYNRVEINSSLYSMLD